MGVLVDRYSSTKSSLILSESSFPKTQMQHGVKAIESDSASLAALKIKNPSCYNFSEINKSNIDRALQIIEACFPIVADRLDAKNELTRYQNDDLNFYSKYLGARISLVSYKIFYREETPVAVGGLYKIDGESHRAYLRWFGVAPNYRGKIEGSSTTIAHAVVKYFKTFARKIGCTSFAALAEDTKENLATQRFYKRAGFTVDRKFTRLGEADRMYECKLGREHPTAT